MRGGRPLQAGLPPDASRDPCGRRRLLLALAGAGLAGCSLAPTSPPAALVDAMYRAALASARRHVRPAGDSVFGKPFVDAAFSSNIFLWDTCFIACYAKYHPELLPIANALDNFHALQEADGYICREYDANGRPVWPKAHPVSINPPLLAFAELELFGQSGDLARLRRVYPALKRHFDYLAAYLVREDGLCFNDALGSGMDNIPRHPEGWQDDGQGIVLAPRDALPFDYRGLDPAWNVQGRAVDTSAQMALCAENLARIARLIGRTGDVPGLRHFHAAMKKAINAHCWHEEDGFYYDLGYGRQIRRKHVGMFWTMAAGVVPPERVAPLLRALVDPASFWRTVPVASYPADQPGFAPEGAYWLGGVWAPTNYMVIRGLQRYGRHALAARLARRYYDCVAEVYQRTGTFWENLAPDAVQAGQPAKPDFCGWSAIAPITLAREFIAPERKVIFDAIQ
ncbi:MGH1-like glycoside hydrolase domain-containing protein [Massilia agri]|uniref:Trehalase family glycosidase n=1 Tax=Massilia agri TaxID=1886785 RepID=A0ABT2ALM5_9BURK|nr:trehalase family glycosidase [Massilia agri]MCS0597118.1 trehalase family glycosidase [Massilia agri]